MATASHALDRAQRETRLRIESSLIARPETRSFWSRLGPQVCLMTIVAAAVVLPRSYLTAQAHSESFDDVYHLRRGLMFLSRGLYESNLELNDAPLGEGIVALPLAVTNLIEGRALTDDRLYDVPHRAETIAARIALWNSTLFVGFLAIVFTWCRRIYGTRSAWLAAALFVFEPNFAAHIPIAAIDVLGVEGIVIGVLLAWRYFERPTTLRLFAMALGAGFALTLKHTAVMLGPVILGMAGLHWVVQPWMSRQNWTAWKRAIPGRVRALALLGVMVPLAIWAFTLFDFSPPLNRLAIEEQSIGTSGQPVSPDKARRVAFERSLRLDSPWPAGCYLSAFRSGMRHGVNGHRSFLFGERRMNGWWKYFPVVASFKVPIGIGVILALTLLSLWRTPPRWAEWGMFLPMLAWTLFLMNSKVNVGFRHFLPPYAFMLMLAGRCLIGSGRAWSAAVWALAAAAAIDSLVYHPDYLAYMNAPRTKPYLAISDCNIDWGQSLKQVRTWLDEKPRDGRPVSLFYFGTDEGSIKYYLNDRVISVNQESPRPTTGWLLISPVRMASVYEDSDLYAALRAQDPDDVIGRSIFVYDLDRLGQGAPFRWPPAPWLVAH